MRYSARALTMGLLVIGLWPQGNGSGVPMTKT